MAHHHHPPAALAGAIIAHYLRNLTIAQGKRWTPANDRDMQRLTELLGDLGPRAVHDHDPDAEGDEQRQVLREHRQGARLHELAGKGDDERLATKRVDVGRH